MTNSINLTEIQHYSQALARKLTDYYFIDHQSIKGEAILNFCDIKQVNLLVIKTIYERWQAETEKLESPFFDYDHPEVKEGLRVFMNVLSRHIHLQKKHFTPLLIDAIQDTLLLILNPKSFYEQEIQKFQGLKITKDKFESIFKYIQFNRELLRMFIQRLELLYKGEFTVAEATNAFQDVYADNQRYIEPVDWRLKSFSDMLPLDMAKIWGTEENIAYKLPKFMEIDNPKTVIEDKIEPLSELPALTETLDDSLEGFSQEIPTLQEVITEPQEDLTVSEQEYKMEVITEKLPDFIEKLSQEEIPTSSSLSLELSDNVEKNIEKSEPHNLAEVLQQGKLGSLRDAIPLGQKFEFSNHLFGGDSLQLNDAIDKLDACANYEEARRLTTDYFLQYNWDFDSEAYQQFMAYVERRF